MRTPKLESHVFRGVRWTLRWVTTLLGERTDDDEDTWIVGRCDRAGVVNCEMQFVKSQRGLMELETYIHEPLHACFPDCKEEAITEAAEDIASFLWALGYRRTR